MLLLSKSAVTLRNRCPTGELMFMQWRILWVKKAEAVVPQVQGGSIQGRNSFDPLNQTSLPNDCNVSPANGVRHRTLRLCCC